MMTPDAIAPSSMSILLLGGCTIFVAVALLVITYVGLRALLLGKDDVCVFSWRFPLELLDHTISAGRSVLRLRDLPAALSAIRLPDAPQQIPDSGIMRSLAVLYLRISFFLLRRKLRPVRPRRAIQSNHYQTYGARMRSRATQQAA